MEIYLRKSYIKGGFLYLQTKMNPAEHLNEGESIVIFNEGNNKKYKKEWGRSGIRFFIYGMKEIYETFDTNNPIEINWKDNNVLNLKVITDSDCSNKQVGNELYEVQEEQEESVIVKIYDRNNFREDYEFLGVMPSLYIILNELNSKSSFYIGHSRNMYERLNTYNTKPPGDLFSWQKVLVFVHGDGSPCYVDEAMRLEYKALSHAKKTNNRLKNKKGAINLYYKDETVKDTDKMFKDIITLVNKKLNLDIFS